LNRAWLGLGLSLLGLGALGSGCQSIIDLEDRTYDPNLSATGGRASGSGGSSGAQGGSNAMGGSMAMTPCQEYCALAEKNCPNPCPQAGPCPDDLSLYISTGACLKVCESFEPGVYLEEDTESGNTLACRLREVTFAGQLKSDKIEHCAQAGPGGNGVCGDDCESYCALMDEFCATPAFEQFTDPDCLANCRGISPEKRTDSRASLFGASRHHDGDNLQCRLVHASSASVSPATHCWHAALVPLPLEIDGGDPQPNPCADPAGTVPSCDVYCRLVQVSCQDEFAEYESEAQCLAVCNALPGGADGNNNVSCRRTHAYNALAYGPETHCPHAGPGGKSVCGSNCESYCSLLEQGCADDFAGTEECVEECETLEGADDPFSVTAAEAGDNFGCRMLALIRALDKEPELCADAIGGGECQ
jgi:hypothetical protein